MRHEGSPEFPSAPFLASIWGRMAIDYIQKVTEGERCLTQLGSKSDGLKELKRLARYSKGWQFHRTFKMESSRGYWRRFALPKIDLETGRAEYRVALPEVLASFGVGPGGVKPGAEAGKILDTGKGRKTRRQKGKGEKEVANTTTGAQEGGMLYHAGKRLLKPERNLAMAHAPRSGKETFCWDWNVHGWCGKVERCDRNRDATIEKNLHWAVAAELIRRGWRKNRNTRILPEHVDGMVAQLRETNQRVHGEQPIAENHAWWQKTAGSQHTLDKMRRPAPGPGAGWETTKRTPDWAKVDRVGQAPQNDYQPAPSTIQRKPTSNRCARLRNRGGRR